MNSKPAYVVILRNKSANENDVRRQKLDASREGALIEQDLTLSIDVGTGSVRAALVDRAGAILSIAAEEQQQIVPAFGWAEQSVEGWWSGVTAAIRRVLQDVSDAAQRIAAICACGQMHGTVLIDDDGSPTRANAPLWNDKRTVGLVREFESRHRSADYLAQTGNPATPAWPGFKLAWLRDHDPEAYARASTVLMPKDFINFRLTGQRAMDPGDASVSFLMDPAQRTWSKTMAQMLGIGLEKLPEIRDPLEILGSVTDAAARATGLRAGTPVLVGGGDYPVSLLGSGACRTGLASDVTGTSCILTLIAEKPLLDPEICNVLTVEGHWGPFVLLESGGDAMRWARRAFHENTIDYADIVSRAADAPPGSGALFFLPYLAGERLGEHRNARAQYFGLGAAHGLPHLHRAVMEGVAFAAARHLRIMESAAGRPVERVIASGGGVKTALWLKIKASIYGVPVAVPREAECGVIGCAAMAQTAIGRHARLEDAVDTLVAISEVVAPDPAWAETYARMQPIFDRLYLQSQSFYDQLDAIAS